jgi:N-methylhydantoinase A/oxoprolinase/acetone carboxylase beta subunit
VDAARALRVGPRSAGAQPGPACYGLGGIESTVTDANLTLGYLDPARVYGRAIRLDRERARLALDTLARRLGLSLPIVVLDDGWLSLIQVKQARRRFGFYGTDLGEHAHVEPPAHYFGVPAVGARSAAELAGALRDALAADHPTVIETKVDPSHYLETVYD